MIGLVCKGGLRSDLFHAASPFLRVTLVKELLAFPVFILLVSGEQQQPKHLLLYHQTTANSQRDKEAPAVGPIIIKTLLFTLE